jgi:hypothetical protein
MGGAKASLLGRPVNPSRFFMHVSLNTSDVFSFSTLYILYYSRSRDDCYIRN